jgi:hypothetical protein
LILELAQIAEDRKQWRQFSKNIIVDMERTLWERAVLRKSKRWSEIERASRRVSCCIIEEIASCIYQEPVSRLAAPLFIAKKQSNWEPKPTVKVKLS